MKLKNRFVLLLFSTVLIACAPARGETPTGTAIPTSTRTRVPVASTLTPSPTPPFPKGSSIVSPLDGMTQLSVPAGEFRMGTLEDGEWVSENEMPQHTVYLEGFWMDETEVTNAQYAKCVEAGACTPPHRVSSYSKAEYYGNPEFDDFPVVYVDWTGAKTYCEWAGRRLPTEAEWEKAARGTDARLYPWAGDAKGESFANFTFNMFQDPVAVKTYRLGVSPYGMYDMAGNVYEWVADWYAPDYYAGSPAANPAGPDTGLTRVMRGGGWGSDWVYLRTAARMHYYPQDSSSDLGFRCAQPQ